MSQMIVTMVTYEDGTYSCELETPSPIGGWTRRPAKLSSSQIPRQISPWASSSRVTCSTGEPRIVTYNGGMAGASVSQLCIVSEGRVQQ
jgi:hypothetical protein